MRAELVEGARRLKRQSMGLIGLTVLLWFVVNSPDNRLFSMWWWVEFVTGAVLIYVALNAWSDLQFARRVLRGSPR